MAIELKVVNGPEVAAALKRAGVAPGAVLDAAIKAAADVVRDAAASAAPGPEIGIERVKEAEYDVGPEKERWYYRFFETGTQPHEVSPRQARALYLGGDVFSAGHVVGGMPAQPFLRPAVDEKSDAAADAAGQVIKRALD